jgi:hypothetical protein
LNSWRLILSSVAVKVVFLLVGVALFPLGMVLLSRGQVPGGIASLLGGAGLLVTVLSSL